MSLFGSRAAWATKQLNARKNPYMARCAELGARCAATRSGTPGRTAMTAILGQPQADGHGERSKSDLLGEGRAGKAKHGRQQINIGTRHMKQENRVEQRKIPSRPVRKILNQARRSVLPGLYT